MDQMVLKTQQWLNATYRGRNGFGSVTEDGQTGWGTINGLIRALQIELGITVPVNNFGPGTRERFSARWPQGIRRNSERSNVHAIIQGALWCKGYPAHYGAITAEFTAGMADSIVNLKRDIGLTDRSSAIDVDLMESLLSMKQFKLLADYGGKSAIRTIQQIMNREHGAYTGILPTDGLYGREMNTGLIQVLQKLEGFTPSQATGNFGSGTRGRLQTINSGNGEWVWLASAALVCNGQAQNVTRTWTGAMTSQVRSFQQRHALPVTGQVDPTTWMSLLTSKGDPNRACVACDTRFEITDELARALKSDGYTIVGRYLSEPGQEGLGESEYFKALRAGELERIVGHGLQYFPIFQEYSTKLTHFTVANARRHAKEAQAAARRLGVPPTVIYFAVDYDATDPEVTSHILPYFRALNESLGGSYRVGIYASRNICTRVKEAGYASGIFVSDMSTGFSGNLGFPIPDGWVFDQFSEISGYQGKWDLDRVAYSGMQPACDAVMPSSLPHTGLPEEFIDLVEALEDRFTELRRANPNGAFGKDLVVLGSTPTWVEVPTWRCVLNYLAKSYLKGSKKWALSAEAYRDRDAAILEGDSEAQQIIARLDQWIAGERRNWIDPSGGEVDIAHMCVTTLGYINTNPLVADKWTGWAGDLASALGPIQAVVDLNPTADVNAVARALVGQKDNFTSHEGLRGLNLPSDLPNNCNYSDLCSDGDAIAFARILESVGSGEVHTLSQTFRGYYNNPGVLADRFKQIAYSVGARDLDSAKEKFSSEIKGFPEELYVGFLADGIDGIFDYGDVELRAEVKKAACFALAEFIF